METHPVPSLTPAALTLLSPQAYIQFEKEDEAIAMAKFYNGNVTPMVCGRAVRVTHSLSYPTIQVGRPFLLWFLAPREELNVQSLRFLNATSFCC